MTLYLKNYKKDIATSSSTTTKEINSIISNASNFIPMSNASMSTRSSSIVESFGNTSILKISKDQKNSFVIYKATDPFSSTKLIIMVIPPSDLSIYNLDSAISKFREINSQYANKVEIYGFYPGNSELVLFNMKSNIVVPTDSSELIDGCYQYDSKIVGYRGSFLSFNKYDSDFFKNVHYITCVNNRSPLIYNLNPALYQQSPINALLSKLNGKTFTGIQLQYTTVPTKIDHLTNFLSRSYSTTSIFYKKLDDTKYKLHPVYITVNNNYYMLNDTITGSKALLQTKSSSTTYYSVIIGICLGNYSSAVIKFKDKYYPESKGYVYTLNSDGTCNVDTEDNLDKLGVIFIFDELNYPMYIKYNELKTITLSQMLNRTNKIIKFCADKKVKFYYSRYAEFDSENIYDIGQMNSVLPNPTVTDLPANLSMLDKY